MANITADKIRNVVVMGHGGTGKTSLVEAMLFSAKASDRFGKVSDGTTTTDYDPEEIKRKFSINTAVAPFDWNGVKINMIDTPGYFDFVGEVMGGVRVADCALIVVNARGGVQVGAENAWEYATNRGIPKMFFVNGMDDENADFAGVLASLQDTFGTSVAPFRVPFKVGGKLAGCVDVLSGKAYAARGDNDNEVAVPADMEGTLAELKEKLIEAVVETDEELMEKYFGGEDISEDALSAALKAGIHSGDITPVFGGCATDNVGAVPLMTAIAKYAPSPAEAKGEGDVKCDPNAPVAALIFKTVADPYVGKMSIFKVYSGTLRADSTLYNPNTDSNEKIGKLFYLRGKKQIDTDAVTAGDIGVVTKLASSVTGNTLCAQGSNIQLEGIDFPKPNLSMAILPKAKGDEEKIGTGLAKLTEEDPTFKVENNAETHQMVISGIGEQHLDVITSKLKSKFGVSVDLEEPKIPYREAIRKQVEVQGRHKKQSGGHGQFGDVWIRFSPHEGTDLIFEEEVFGGSVPKNFFPAVEKGLRECINKGVLAGYPVVGLKAVLYDGSYHPVDSSEMAFKTAASLAYKAGLTQANPVLLEPIGHLEVTIPSAYMGDVMGDVSKRRGRLLGSDQLPGGKTKVIAEVPIAEMHTYATDLRSMTQARGSFTLAFERYEDAPANVAQKVIEAAKAEAEE